LRRLRNRNRMVTALKPPFERGFSAVAMRFLFRNRLCFFGYIGFPAEWLRAVGQPPNKWVPPKDRFFPPRKTKSPYVTKPHTGRKYSLTVANYKITLDCIGQIVYNIIAGTGEISMCMVVMSPYTCRRVRLHSMDARIFVVSLCLF